MWSRSAILSAFPGEGGGVGQGGRGGPGGGLLGGMPEFDFGDSEGCAWVDGNEKSSMIFLLACSGLGER